MAAFVVSALVAGAVTGGIAVAAGATAMTLFGSVFLTAAIPAFGSALVLGGLSKALTKKPEAPRFATSSAGSRVTIRQPISPWRILVGEDRVPGVITFVHQSADKQHLHLVITFLGHVAQEIVDVHFNNEIVALDSAGNATGKYAGHVFIRKSLGAETTQAFPELQVESDGRWTAEHLQRGHTKIHVRLKANRDIFPTGVPNITAHIKGWKLFDPRTAATAWSHNVALAGSSYLTDATFGFSAVYADEIDADTLTSSANTCEERVPLAAATAGFTADAGADTLAVAVGNRVPLTGDGVRVASTGALPGGLAAATTYYAIRTAGALIKLASNYANALAGTAIDITSAGSGTHTLTYFDEPRYSANGSFLTSEKPKEIIERLVPAMAGRAVNVGGKWYLFAGAYTAPTVTLDEGDLAGAIETQSLVSRRENANGVKGIYIDPSKAWQPTDFPALASSTYLAEDNNERVWRDIDLSGFTRSASMAQRLAKIELLRTRQGQSVAAPFKLSGYVAMTGKTVALTNTKFGWSAKAYELMAGRFVFAEDGTLGVDMELRETAAAIFDWTTSEEQTVDFAPNTSLPDPTQVTAPGTPSVTEALYETRDGRGVGVKAIVTAITPDPFVRSMVFEHKVAADSTWIVHAAQQTDGAGAATIEILDLAPAIYEFRARAVNTLGVRSSYSVTRTQEIHGLGARPAAPTGVSLSAAGGLAILSLTQHPELDVLRGGRILVRHSEATAGAAWEGSFSIGEADGYPGDAVLIVLPLKPGSYLLKARDSSESESVAATVVTTKQASVLTFSSVGTLQEDTTFPGTHANTVAVDGLLKLAGAGDFDTIPDFDAISSLDGYGGIELAGTYTFSAGLNLGAVTKARVTGQIDGLTVNTLDKFDDRTGLLDDWLDFDGPSGGGSADAWLEVRETDDNPSGAPTWSAWRRLDAAEIEAWGLQFRLQMVTSDPAYNLHVDTLRARAESVV